MKMKSDEYYSVAGFITNTLRALDDFLEPDSYYKPTTKSRALASKILMTWSKAAKKDLEKYKTPEKAAKVAALLKALADLIE